MASFPFIRRFIEVFDGRSSCDAIPAHCSTDARLQTTPASIDNRKLLTVRKSVALRPYSRIKIFAVTLSGTVCLLYRYSLKKLKD